jgi:hypothetical protein
MTFEVQSVRKNSTVWLLLVQELMVRRGFSQLFVLMKSFLKMAEMSPVETSSDDSASACVMIPRHIMCLRSFKYRFKLILSLIESFKYCFSQITNSTKNFERFSTLLPAPHAA